MRNDALAGIVFFQVPGLNVFALTFFALDRQL
ncbi:MAG: hypothetical protein H6Q04_2136 [Acidobacteria bacterium]|nr:hypothetical protein [Acidobacteriota bacterium]